MKSLYQSSTGRTLARHQDRARRRLPLFPQTDYHFHTPAEDVVAMRDQHVSVGSAQLRAFRQMSQEYFGEETHRSYILETVVLALITGVIAWPIIAMLIAYARISNG